MQCSIRSVQATSRRKLRRHWRVIDSDPASRGTSSLHCGPDVALRIRHRLHGRLHYVSKAHLLLDFAYRLATHSSVLDTVSSIIGPDILLWDSTFIIKEPGDGRKVSWHQDLTYWGLDPDDVVSVWLALSQATIESGCMVMIPGSHKGPIAAHHDSRASDNILSRGQTIAEPIDESRARHVVLAPGELSLHHGRVWHSSSPNRSEDRRIAFNAQYLAP